MIVKACYATLLAASLIALNIRGESIRQASTAYLLFSAPQSRLLRRVGVPLEVIALVVLAASLAAAVAVAVGFRLGGATIVALFLFARFAFGFATQKTKSKSGRSMWSA